MSVTQGQHQALVYASENVRAIAGYLADGVVEEDGIAFEGKPELLEVERLMSQDYPEDADPAQLRSASLGMASYVCIALLNEILGELDKDESAENDS